MHALGFLFMLLVVFFLASTGAPNSEDYVDYLSKLGSFVGGFFTPVLTVGAVWVAYKQLRDTAKTNHEQLFFAPLLNTFTTKLDKTYEAIKTAQELILPSNENYSLMLGEAGNALNFPSRLLGEIDPCSKPKPETLEFIETHKAELFLLTQECELYLELYENALQSLSKDSSNLLQQICANELAQVIKVLNALSCLTGTFCSLGLKQLDQFEKRIDKLTALAVYKNNLDDYAECKTDISQRCEENWRQDT